MTIDGKDILQEYGCTLLWGSFDSLLKYPKRKTVEYNDWAEQNGIEPYLETVEFEPKSISLHFLMESTTLDSFWDSYKKLYASVTESGYHVFKFTDNISYKLRYDTTSNYNIPQPFNMKDNFTSFALNFIDDNPKIPDVNNLSGNNLSHGLYQINGYDFGLFGVGSDQGQEDILKYPQLKKPFSDGRTIQLDYPRFSHKEIKLSLWLIAKDEAEFLANYRAFFTQISAPQTQLLNIQKLGISTNVYYSDCTNFKIDSWDKNMKSARFSISLIIPVPTWIQSGGTKTYRALRDHGTFKVLGDRRGRIITFS